MQPRSTFLTAAIIGLCVWSPYTSANGSNSFVYPFESESAYSAYWVLDDSYAGHEGTDYACTNGTPVYASITGEVTEAHDDELTKSCEGYGNVIVISDGTYSVKYAHLLGNSVPFEVGDYVVKGVFVGKTSNTGWSTNTELECLPNVGYHLHYEVRDEGIPVDPYTHDGGLFKKDDDDTYHFSAEQLRVTTCHGPTTYDANWFYTCDNPATQFRQGQNISFLSRLEQLTKSHTYKVVYKKDGTEVGSYTWYPGYNRLEVGQTWQYSHFWRTLEGATVHTGFIVPPGLWRLTAHPTQPKNDTIKQFKQFKHIEHMKLKPIYIILPTAILAIIAIGYFVVNRVFLEEELVMEEILSESEEKVEEESPESVEIESKEEKNSFVYNLPDKKGWKAYNNKELGIYFEFPDFLIIEDNSSKAFDWSFLFSLKEKGAEGDGIINLGLTKDDNPFDGEKVLWPIPRQDIEIVDMEVGKQMYKAHRVTVEFNSVDGDVNSIMYFIEFKDQVYRMEFKRNSITKLVSEKIFEEIVSTLQFIK